MQNVNSVSRALPEIKNVKTFSAEPARVHFSRKEREPDFGGMISGAGSQAGLSGINPYIVTELATCA